MMASEHEQQISRNSARRSTGPRTFQGKLRASRNALRHGLAAVTAVSAKTERMAQAICGECTSPLQYAEALNIAESDLLVQNVRAARIALMKRMMGVSKMPNEQSEHSTQSPAQGETAPAPAGLSMQEIEEEANAFERALPALAALDRYERRALSRRRRAIRTFVATSILGMRPTCGKK